MKFYKSILILVVTTTAAVSIAACGNTSATSSSAAAAKEGIGGTLIIGATFSNIPNMDVIPDQGYEGRRFVGNQLYDPLIKQNPNTNEIEPALAQSYETNDNKVWTFHLRPNVKFHDGTPWNADAAVFNMERIMNKDFQYYYPPVAALMTSKTKTIASYKALDDRTFQITLKEPDSFFVSDLTQILFASPAAVKKFGNDDYQNHPIGTGPFKMDKMVPRQELDLVPNKDYWNSPPKLDKLVLRPMPDPASRLAAVLAGQINWAEVPPTESILQLKQKGFQVLTKPYPHIWEVIPNIAKPPFNDKRVREAFVEAIDRKAMSEKLLNGASAPANGAMFPDGKYFPKDAPTYPYNVENAKKLLAEAGYSGGLNITLNMPTSGSGNMWPLPMSEFIQSEEEKVGIHVKFRTYDWNEILTQKRTGFESGALKDADGLVFSSAAGTLLTDLESNVVLPPPAGGNIMGYDNKELAQMNQEAKVTTDGAKRDQLLTQGWAIEQKDLAILPVVHDLNLRVLSPKVKGFVTPASWFCDLTTVWIQ